MFGAKQKDHQMRTDFSAIVIIFLCLSLFFSYKKLYENSDEIKRLNLIIKDDNKQITYYKAKNGQLVANTNVLQLKYTELKQVLPSIINEIKNLKINPKHVLSYSESVIENKKNIITILKDSILHDTVNAKVFNYNDEFYSIYGIAINDTQRVNITSRDSLIQVIYKGERYKPYLWFFSKRKILQAITSKNPNSTVLYSKHIEIIKK